MLNNAGLNSAKLNSAGLNAAWPRERFEYCLQRTSEATSWLKP